MTRIEMETMSLIKAACREYIDTMRSNEIDWEQRRYEIAMMCAANGRSIEHSIATADALIKELKKKKED